MLRDRKSGSAVIVTIDGPAASGKSTTARLSAKRLGWLYLDTGAMYRAVTLKVLQNGLNLKDADAIGNTAASIRIELKPSPDRTRIFLDGVDVTWEIRTPQVDRAVGPVCEVPEARAVMVEMQRRIGDKDSLIVEGRDMGTVVFPDADLKFFMQAGIEARALRRFEELRNRGISASLETLRKEIEARDYRDSHRAHSPLKKADDAIVIDTTDMTIEEQVDFIIDQIRRRGFLKGRTI